MVDMASFVNYLSTGKLIGVLLLCFWKTVATTMLTAVMIYCSPEFPCFYNTLSTSLHDILATYMSAPGVKRFFCRHDSAYGDGYRIVPTGLFVNMITEKVAMIVFRIGRQ